MRSTVRAALAACALGLTVSAGLVGCVEGDRVPLVAPGTAPADQIAALPGVLAAVTSQNPATGRVDLDVDLRDDVSTSDLAIIASAVRAFGERRLPDGSLPGQRVIAFGESEFSYFDAGDDAAIASQLDYWLALARLGFERVTMREIASYGSFASSPDTTTGSSAYTDDSGTGAEPASPSAAGRYVLLELPDEADAAGLASLVEQARAAGDPGAADGEWELTAYDDQARATFAQPALPTAGDVSRFAEFGAALAALDAHAAFQLDADPAASPPLSAELMVFDDALASATKSTAEAQLEQSAAWQPLTALVDSLDETGSDFEVALLANPLQDAGNFELGLSVRGCVLTGDADWPQASSALAESWLRHRATVDPRSVATGRCSVSTSLVADPTAAGGSASPQP